MVFDPIALRENEQRLRDLLIADPCDQQLRLDLAWCLFMQAVCGDIGQQMGPERSGENAGDSGRTAPAGLYAGAFSEALKAASLGHGEGLHGEVARLGRLMGWVGQDASVSEAHRQVDGALMRLAIDAYSAVPRV